MPLNKDFFLQDAVTTARKLVGKRLIREYEDRKIVCRIVETEAYCGPEDKASHAYNNKKTKRTEIMFASGGQIYVYLIYGLYYCLNIVTGREGEPEAVLIRAVEPLEGLDIIKQNRKIKAKREEELTNGPGKLCEALKIDKGLNGYSLSKSTGLYIENEREKDFAVEEAERKNIDYSEEYRNKLWRYYIKDNSFVSA